METQTQTSQNGWLPLQRSTIEFRQAPQSLKFVLVQRGSVRAGAWLMNGQPLALVPAGVA